jgi:hypothetical protein
MAASTLTPEQFAIILARLDTLTADIRELERRAGILEAEDEDRDDIADAESAIAEGGDPVSLEDLEAEFGSVSADV